VRILLVTEDLPQATPGGAAQHAVVLGNALIDAGHEVHLLGARREGGEAAAPGDNGFAGPLHAGIDFRGARWQERRTGTFFPLTRPHTARRLAQALAAVTARHGPWDLVHYHGHNALFGLQVTGPFVHTLHDQGAECITWLRFRQGRVCNERDARACAGCATPQPNALQTALSAASVRALRAGSLAVFTRHQAIFVSAFLRRRWREQQGAAADAAHTHVVHNFVDAGRLRRARAAPAPGPSDGRLRVLVAGRIDAAKGVGALLALLRDESLAKLDLTVAGSGPEFEAQRAAHAPRGVRFTGWLPAQQVLELAVAADVCVVPSVWEEPCATTVLEALSLGRTVLALERGGTPELAVYGEPGQLRFFDDLPALCAALAAHAPSRWPSHERAAVQARLPEILNVYRAARGLER
jgi:glycosyltransferase involved in cell wall biosynthesis